MDGQVRMLFDFEEKLPRAKKKTLLGFCFLKKKTSVGFVLFLVLFHLFKISELRNMNTKRIKDTNRDFVPPLTPLNT